MQIELSDEEIETLDKALTAYENSDATSSLLGVMLSSMVPEGERGKYEAKRREEEQKAEILKRGRRIQATLIRAKMYQAQSNTAFNQLTGSAAITGGKS